MELVFKPKEECDRDFTIELFFDHKVKELNAECWPDSIKNQICSMQYDAFCKSWDLDHENTVDFILQNDSVSVGRLILLENSSSIFIKYIAVLYKFQNKGIAKTVIENLISRSEKDNKELKLSVSKNNQAYYLYLKLGFVVSGEDEVNFFMEFAGN